MNTNQKPSALADALRKRIEELNISQTEIADGTGVRQSTVGRFLRADVDPQLSNFEAILDFVNRYETLKAAGLIRQPLKLGPPRGIRKAAQEAGAA